MSSTVEIVPIGESVFRESSRILGVKRCVDDPGSYGVESNVLFRVFDRQASHDGIQTTFSDHRNGSGFAGNWIIGQRGVMLTMLPPVFWASICLTASCVM